MAGRLLIENRMYSGRPPGIRYLYEGSYRDLMFDLDNRLMLRSRRGLRSLMHHSLKKLMKGWTGMRDGYTMITTPKLFGHMCRVHVTYASTVKTTYFRMECHDIVLKDKLSDLQIVQRSIT